MALSPQGRIRIVGVLEFHSGTRQLVGPHGRVALAPKEFELLSLLVANRPSAISKEEIHDALWPDTIVAETSLSTLVNDLRSKIGQTGRDGPIRTVHGFGYALDADGAAPADGRAPRLCRGGAEIVLDAPMTILGREPGAPGTIDDASVSRRHARVAWDGERATLEDLGSKNGTFVRGERTSGPVALEDGDEVRLGLVLFVFRDAQAPGQSTTKTVV